MTKKTYTVGYGKPPKHSRFKPGQSGNPKGRPKGARGFAAELDEELNQTISVTENGRTYKLTKRRVIFKSLCAKAIHGDPKAIQLIFSKSEQLRGEGLFDARDLAPIDRMIIKDYMRHYREPDDDDKIR